MAVKRKNSLKLEDKSISQQIAALRVKYPHFISSFDSHTGLIIKGTLQPTARSDVYHFEMKYSINSSPELKITSPQLIKNSKGDSIPHLYSGMKLCLYYPKYREFKRTDYLCDTIIPWASLWLYYYEVWHLTGEWLGGGISHTT